MKLLKKLTEFLFPRYGVRYIAINDNYDSEYRDGNELAPFKKLFNEWFAKDTSRKIRAVQKAKGERGNRVGTTIPYGYRRDPDGGRECRLLENEETAPVVKEIFSIVSDRISLIHILIYSFSSCYFKIFHCGSCLEPTRRI